MLKGFFIGGPKRGLEGSSKSDFLREGKLNMVPTVNLRSWESVWKRTRPPKPSGLRPFGARCFASGRLLGLGGCFGWFGLDLWPQATKPSEDQAHSPKQLQLSKPQTRLEHQPSCALEPTNSHSDSGKQPHSNPKLAEDQPSSLTELLPTEAKRSMELNSETRSLHGCCWETLDTFLRKLWFNG